MTYTLNDWMLVFVDVAVQIAPFMVAWDIGTFIVNVLVRWMTGRGDKI